MFKKTINFVKNISMFLSVKMIFAADMTGVAALDNTIGTGERIISILAKWGGIALLVSGGIMFGLGKVKGEALSLGVWIILGLGLIIAGFGWWNTAFTSGFSF